MGFIHIMERNGESERFESALMKAKKGIMEAYEIFSDMKEEFGERGGYGERYGERYRGGYHGRDYDEMGERRDSRGRYM